MRVGGGGGGQAHLALADGAEFDVVRALLAGWGPAARGVGDDCAVLDVPRGERLCVSVDTSVEAVHFRREWLTPEEIGYRATTAALSDLAAMGATPLAVLLAITLPRRWLGAAVELGTGVGDAARAAQAAIVGGDTTGGEQLSLTITAVGSARAPVPRGGARDGDRVYVTGALGGPGAAVAAFERGDAVPAAHRARFARPSARVDAGRWLARAGASAMIDVSDGLVADLAHVAAASAVRIVVDLARVPAIDGATPAGAAVSGEEYELAATSSAPLDTGAFEASTGLALSEIGRVERGPAGVEVRSGGARVDLPAGYRHLSR